MAHKTAIRAKNHPIDLLDCIYQMPNPAIANGNTKKELMKNTYALIVSKVEVLLRRLVIRSGLSSSCNIFMV